MDEDNLKKYEDEDLMIVNKEPFLLTHPTQKKADFTLANGIVYYFKEKYGQEMVPRFYNRLDMNTSIFAKFFGF